MHLAKRFYDMAAETSADAHLPVSIVLFKLHLEFLWERLRAYFSSSSPPPSTTDQPTTTSTTNANPNLNDAAEFDSFWDLYLIAALIGFIGALFTMRRQRAALRRQGQIPVQ